MEFEIEKDQKKYNAKMVLVEKMENHEEIIKTLYENDILHLFINPKYARNL